LHGGLIALKVPLFDLMNIPSFPPAATGIPACGGPGFDGWQCMAPVAGLKKARLLEVAAVIVLACAGALQGKDFDVRQYGAAGDGTTMDTAAIQKAVDAASAEGGGTVVLARGTFLSGSIDLKSRVTLRVDQDAMLLGSPSRSDYRKLNFYGLILANEQEDVGICGKGVIDGQGKRLVADTMRLLAEGKVRDTEPNNRPYASVGERPVLINFRKCRNVTVRDITLRESSCWVQEYRECNGVLIENVTVRTMAAITNDGLDIDSCSNVVVRGCNIDSEDDGICLKSGPLPCENVLVENCRVRSTCNALKFGTASDKGFRNITCRNLVIYDTYLSGIALEIVDGGSMENVNISNVRMTTTNNPLFIRLGHRNVKVPPGTIKGVTISDVTAEIPNRPRSEMNKFPEFWRHMCTTLITGSITGLPGHPVRDVTLKNISFTYGGIGDAPKPNHHRFDRLDKVPECAQNYPESKMFGILPAWGLFIRHAEGITLENVTLRVTGKDYRPAITCDDVRSLTLDRVSILSAGTDPLIVLKDVQGASVINCPPPPNTKRFIEKLGTTGNVGQGVLQK